MSYAKLILPFLAEELLSPKTFDELARKASITLKRKGVPPEVFAGTLVAMIERNILNIIPDPERDQSLPRSSEDLVFFSEFEDSLMEGSEKFILDNLPLKMDKGLTMDDGNHSLMSFLRAITKLEIENKIRTEGDCIVKCK